ncbi:hypothetical protein FJZ31_14500 [Candidatus Poribacteria bacterium]|nr:hypothetical protein [Candidatus Poribacteria bacterium]
MFQSSRLHVVPCFNRREHGADAADAASVGRGALRASAVSAAVNRTTTTRGAPFFTATCSYLIHYLEIFG